MTNTHKLPTGGVAGREGATSPGHLVRQINSRLSHGHITSQEAYRASILGGMDWTPLALGELAYLLETRHA